MALLSAWSEECGRFSFSGFISVWVVFGIGGKGTPFFEKGVGILLQQARTCVKVAYRHHTGTKVPAGMFALHIQASDEKECQCRTDNIDKDSKSGLSEPG